MGSTWKSIWWHTKRVNTHSHIAREHMQANRNRSKAKSARVCVWFIFVLLNVSDAGVENGKTAWIRPQKLKHSKLIFEFFFVQMWIWFEVLNTSQNSRHVHCIRHSDSGQRILSFNYTTFEIYLSSAKLIHKPLYQQSFWNRFEQLKLMLKRCQPFICVFIAFRVQAVCMYLKIQLPYINIHLKCHVE